MTYPLMIYKLGPSGNLRTLPGIRWGETVESTRGPAAAINTTLGNKSFRDIIGPVKRTWTLSWSFLLIPEMEEIEAIQDGFYGMPLLFDDPFDSGPTVGVVVTSYTRSFVTPIEANVSLGLLES